MDAVKYIEARRGWLAFRAGRALRNIHRHTKVFRTEEEARKALAKSKVVWSW